MTSSLIHGCEKADTPFPTNVAALQKNKFVKRGDTCDLLLTATPSRVLQPSPLKGNVAKLNRSLLLRAAELGYEDVSDT